MLKAPFFLRTLAVAPVLSVLGGCLFLPVERDGSNEDVVRVAATPDGGALVYLQRAIGKCTAKPFDEVQRCNLVSSWHLVKVPGAVEPLLRWEVDIGRDEDVQLVRESTPGRYELHSSDGDSLRIRTFDEQGNKVSDELAGPAPTKYNGVGVIGFDYRLDLADGSVLSVDVQARPVTLTHRDPAGQELWTVPNPIGVLDVADSGPAGSTVLGGDGRIALAPVVMKLDAGGTVVWQRDVWTLERYMK